MPKTLQARLAPAEVAKALIAWATRVTDDYLDPRRGTPEDVVHKGFTRPEMINLALLAVQADDIRVTELRAHLADGQIVLPSPNTWQPGPEMWILIQALYREFGYVLAFLAFVREQQAPGRGFTVRKGRSGKKVRAKWSTKATPKIVEEFLRTPGFAQTVRLASERTGLAPGTRTVGQILKRVGYTASESALKEATRKS